MSTTATITPVTTASASHFGFASLGHYVSAGFTAVKNGLKFAESKVIPGFQKIDELAEIPTSALAANGVPYASQALVIERALDSAAGELLAAIHTTDAITGEDFVNLKLPIASYNAFKQFIADQKGNLAALGFSL